MDGWAELAAADVVAFFLSSPSCASLCLVQHNVYELFAGLLRKLVIHKPKDPLSFMITALEQPVQQVGRHKEGRAMSERE